MPKLSDVAKLTFKDGQRERFIEEIDIMFRAVEGEATTEVYVMNLDPKDPNVLWFFEVYSDEAALRRHQASPSMQVFRPKLEEMLAQPFESVELIPTRAKGIAI